MKQSTVRTAKGVTDHPLPQKFQKTTTQHIQIIPWCAAGNRSVAFVCVCVCVPQAAVPPLFVYRGLILRASFDLSAGGPQEPTFNQSDIHVVMDLLRKCGFPAGIVCPTSSMSSASRLLGLSLVLVLSNVLNIGIVDVSGSTVSLNVTGSSVTDDVLTKAVIQYQVSNEVNIDYYDSGSSAGLCNVLGFWHLENNRNPGVSYALKYMDNLMCDSLCTEAKCGFDSSSLSASELHRGPLVDFAISDILLDEEYFTTFPDLVQFPAMATAIVPVVNIPELGDETLVLSRQALANIYAGSINYWNDSSILDTNSVTVQDILLSLPDPSITVVVRYEESGASQVFTNGLTSFGSSNFSDAVIAGTMPLWCGPKTDEIWTITVSSCSLTANDNFISLFFMDRLRQLQKVHFRCSSDESVIAAQVFAQSGIAVTARKYDEVVSSGISAYVLLLALSDSEYEHTNWFQPIVAATNATTSTLSLAVSTFQEGGFVNSHSRLYVEDIPLVYSLFVYSNASFVELTISTNGGVTFNSTGLVAASADDLSNSLYDALVSVAADSTSRTLIANVSRAFSNSVSNVLYDEYRVTFSDTNSATYYSKSLVLGGGAYNANRLNTQTDSVLWMKYQDMNNYPQFISESDSSDAAYSSNIVSTCYRSANNYQPFSYHTARSNEGVPVAVSELSYGIGYTTVEALHQFGGSVRAVSLVNLAGNTVAANSYSVSVALSERSVYLTTNYSASLIDSVAPYAWPICGFNYFLMRKAYHLGGADYSRRHTTIKFLHSFYAGGIVSAYIEDTSGYAPLPAYLSNSVWTSLVSSVQCYSDGASCADVIASELVLPVGCIDSFEPILSSITAYYETSSSHNYDIEVLNATDDSRDVWSNYIDAPEEQLSIFSMFASKTEKLKYFNDALDPQAADIITAAFAHVAVIPIYHVDAYSRYADSNLIFDADVLGQIFAGTIQYWNDSAIQALNPAMAAYLPSARINIVSRSGDVDINGLFFRYLANQSSVFRDTYGISISSASSSPPRSIDIASNTNLAGYYRWADSNENADSLVTYWDNSIGYYLYVDSPSSSIGTLCVSSVCSTQFSALAMLNHVDDSKFRMATHRRRVDERKTRGLDRISARADEATFSRSIGFIRGSPAPSKEDVFVDSHQKRRQIIDIDQFAVASSSSYLSIQSCLEDYSTTVIRPNEHIFTFDLMLSSSSDCYPIAGTIDMSVTINTTESCSNGDTNSNTTVASISGVEDRVMFTSWLYDNSTEIYIAPSQTYIGIDPTYMSVALRNSTRYQVCHIDSCTDGTALGYSLCGYRACSWESGDFIQVVDVCDALRRTRRVHYYVNPDSDCFTADAVIPATVYIQCRYINQESSLGVISYILSGVGVIMCAAVLAVTVYYRDRSILKRSQVSLMFLFLIGGICLNATIVVYVGPSNDAYCLARPWALVMSSTFLFVPLVARLFRVQMVYAYAKAHAENMKALSYGSTVDESGGKGHRGEDEHGALELGANIKGEKSNSNYYNMRHSNRLMMNKFKASVIFKQNNIVMKRTIALLIALDVFIMVLWTIVKPPLSINTFNYYAQVLGQVDDQTCSQNPDGFVIAVASVKAISFTVGCYKAYQAWKMERSMNEAKYFAIAIYNCALVGGIAFVFGQVIYETNSGASFFLVIVGIFFVSTFTVMVIMCPKFYMLSKELTRERSMRNLPVHRLVLHRVDSQKIIEAINENPESVFMKDIDGKNAFELALELHEKDRNRDEYDEDQFEELGLQDMGANSSIHNASAHAAARANSIGGDSEKDTDGHAVTSRSYPNSSRSIGNNSSSGRSLGSSTRNVSRRQQRKSSSRGVSELDRVLLELIKIALPVDVVTKAPKPPHQHGYAWHTIVQSDKYIDIVSQIMHMYPDIATELANAADADGRLAVNVASAQCQRVIRESIYFYRRYEILTLDVPHYISRSCLIHLAIDHRQDKTPVALKFLKKASHFQREIRFRKEFCLIEKFVLPLFNTHDADYDDDFRAELERRKLADYPYCIVMPKGERNLSTIVSNENFVGKDWALIRTVALQLVDAIEHLHEARIIHGDIKPNNLLRINGRLSIIDFKSACRMHVDCVGHVTSSAYLPPEMIYIDEERICVRGVDLDEKGNAMLEGLSYELVPARYSHDIWSFGVILYELCCGSKLFSPDSNGDTDDDNLLDVFEFSDDFKKRKLMKIANTQARNLVSQLLMRDAKLRPTISQVKSHPFLSGRTAPRLLGEDAEYDVFISYRVRSDMANANYLYERLTDAGLRVWYEQI
jgi:ABC-type phosphate transport system substrate-binding protein